MFSKFHGPRIDWWFLVVTRDSYRKRSFIFELAEASIAYQYQQMYKGLSIENLGSDKSIVLNKCDSADWRGK